MDSIQADYLTHIWLIGYGIELLQITLNGSEMRTLTINKLKDCLGCKIWNDLWLRLFIVL